MGPALTRFSNLIDGVSHPGFGKIALTGGVSVYGAAAAGLKGRVPGARHSATKSRDDERVIGFDRVKLDTTRQSTRNAQWT